jgi:hypothetical protein
MERDFAQSVVGDFPTEALLSEVLRSLGRVLAAAGISAECIEQHVAEVVAEARKTPQGAQALNLGSMQRECMELMCLWRRDGRFLDDSGLPAALTVDGSNQSFAALCQTARASSNPLDLLQLLDRFGAIRFDLDGRVVPETPTFILGSQSPSEVVASDGVLKQLSGFIRVLEHNLLMVRRGERPRFERSCSVRVATELLPVFEHYLSERAQLFIDSIDEWLERQSTVASKSGKSIEIGAGAYFLELEGGN